MINRTPYRPYIRKATALKLAVLFSFATSTAIFAESTWYLTRNIEKSSSWNSTSYWNSARDGSGETPSSISSSDIYNTNGKYVRANGVFEGGKLLQEGGRIDIKRASQTIRRDWEVVGENATLHQGIRNDASYIYTVEGTLTLTSPLRVLHTTDGMRGIDFTIGTLTGSGDLIIGSGNDARNTFVSLGVMKFDNFGGTLIVESGSTIAFANDQEWTAPLVVQAGAYFTLNKKLSFPSAKIAGTTLKPGTYSADDLKKQFGDTITEYSNGTLIVGSP